MIFTETNLPGAWTIDVEPIEDERGFFARWYCRNEFIDHGLLPVEAQGNMSYNRLAGTVRGMHLQLPPAAEAKLVRCTQGALHDMIVDCRPDSPTRLQSFGVELSASNRRGLYVPEGFAHGYQTLTDGAEVLYQVSEFYAPGHEVGLRPDDPSLGLQWPIAATTVSEKDRSWPLLSDSDADRFGVPQ